MLSGITIEDSTDEKTQLNVYAIKNGESIALDINNENIIELSKNDLNELRRFIDLIPRK